MSNVTAIVDTIRSGLADDVDEMTRQRARNACDELAAVLASKPGEPLVPPEAPAPSPAPAMFSRPPGVPQSTDPSLLLDAVIAKLRSQLPSEEDSEPTVEPSALRIPFVPLPKS